MQFPYAIENQIVLPRFIQLPEFILHFIQRIFQGPQLVVSTWRLTSKLGETALQSVLDFLNFIRNKQAS